MPRVYRQAAVIPVRTRDEGSEVALVTTLGGKRWVVPKGSLNKGRNAARSGDPRNRGGSGAPRRSGSPEAGRYEFTRDDELYSVDVYLMHVTIVLDYWMEAKVRQRRWMTIDAAATLVRAELQPFVLAVRERLRSDKLLPSGAASALLGRGARR